MSKKVKRFVCPKEGCDSSFERNYKLKLHILKHEGKPPLVCSFEDCTKSYYHAAHLKRHEMTHSNITYSCTFDGCNSVLKTEASLKKHVDIVHEKKVSKTYKCTMCEKKFNKHSWLRQHEYQHTNIKPYKCTYLGCEKRFVRPSRLKAHSKTHAGYPCKIEGCENVSRTWSLHLKHLKVEHFSVKKLQCELCLKTFSKKSNLDDHRQIHLDPKSRPVFVCEYPKCPRFFYQKKNLRHHMKAYHMARPFECNHEHCPLAFKTKEDLERHQQAHDPNVPVSTKLKKKRLRKRMLLSSKTAVHLSGLKTQVNDSSTDKEDCSVEYQQDAHAGLCSETEQVVPDECIQDLCLNVTNSDKEGGKNDNVSIVLISDAEDDSESSTRMT